MKHQKPGAAPRSMTTTPRHRMALAIALAMGTLTLGACGDDNEENVGPVGSIPGGNFAVSRNDGSAAGSVHLYSPDIQTATATLNTGANQGIAFDATGTLYQNADASSFTGIRALARAADLGDGSAFDVTRGREISSNAGKGLTVVDSAGLIVSADVTDSAADIKVFATTAGMNASPIAVIDTPAPVWDIFYHPQADRLYATQTDGVLAVFDNFTDDINAAPDRMITPVDGNGDQVSVNLHGVSTEGTTVVLSDVGSAMSPTDGMLFTFTDDGLINGSLGSFSQIGGDSTMLGNPVDVVLSNGSAIVAEKSNDKLIVYNAIAGRSGNLAPDYTVDFIKPESIELTINGSDQPDSSDLDTPTALRHVVVAHNPTPLQGAGNTGVGQVSMLTETLANAGEFNAGLVSGVVGAQTFRTLENVQFDAAGNTYAVFDVTDGTTVSERGILVMHQLPERNGQSVDAPDRDRVIANAALGLSSPKGIEVVQSRGVMIVADVGDPGVLQVYSLTAGETATPIFTVNDVGNSKIWDMDYDPVNDRLFAAGTAGDVLVYDNFLANGAAASVSRSFRPDSAGAVSNMHGIVYVASTDQVIVSDVGDAAIADDGALYVLNNASAAIGVVSAQVTISGAITMLGNPVDVAFDGNRVFIAEKSNDKLIVYDGVLSLSGAISAAPDSSVDLVKPESVSLLAQP